MKSYILTVSGNPFRITVDTDMRNCAYHILSAACENSLPGFGNGKSSKLYDIIETGGELTYKFQGDTYSIKVEVSE